MQKQIESFLILSIFIISMLKLFSCANPTALTGGAKDTIAPQFDSLQTIPNFQTNFIKKPLEFTFDEWIVVKDAGKQIVVSPPLEFVPKTRIQKKTVIFEFDEKEILKEDVTYIINFGTAVQDITENNAVKDFRFVFSTGDIIDSLEIKGTVVDAITKKAEEGVLVLLYQNTADSVVRKNRPFYFGKTDKSGNYKIQNLKAGTFKIFALKDGNSNYKFDSPEEKIGFMDSLIHIPDTTIASLDFEIFTEDPIISFQDESVEYGHQELVFTQNPKDVKITAIDSIDYFWAEYSKRKIDLWFNTTSKKNIVIQLDTIINDTLKLASKGRDKFIESAELNLDKKEIQKTIASTDSMNIVWNHPIKSFDKSKLILTRDTFKTPLDFEILDSKSKRTISISYPWKTDSTYHIEIFPNFSTDLYGLQNDSLLISFKVLKKEDFGDISLKMDSLDNKKQYIVQLMNQEEVVDTQIIDHETSFEYHYDYLIPGTYSFKIIDDENADGRWTSGNYDLKKQPERIIDHKIDELRANWEVEVLILGKELQ